MGHFKKHTIGNKDYFTKEEFSHYLFNSLSTKIKAFKIEDSAILDSRVVRSDKNILKITIDDFVKNSFKNKEKITLEDIRNIKFKLFKLLSYYEYFRIITSSSKDNKEHKENKDIKIVNDYKLPTLEVSKVFISYINIYKNKQILEKLKNNEFKFEGEFDFNEFLNFFWFCTEFHDVKVRSKDHSIDIKELCVLANSILDKTFPDKDKRKTLTEKHMKLVYEILDTDKNGLLSIEEIDEYFKRRDFFNINEEYMSIVKEFKNFFKKLFVFVKSNFPSF